MEFTLPSKHKKIICVCACACVCVSEYATVIFIFCALVIKNKASVETKHVLDQPVIVIYLARCHLLANSCAPWVLVIKNNTLKLWNVPQSGNSGQTDTAEEGMPLQPCVPPCPHCTWFAGSAMNHHNFLPRRHGYGDNTIHDPTTQPGRVRLCPAGLWSPHALLQTKPRRLCISKQVCRTHTHAITVLS